MTDWQPSAWMGNTSRSGDNTRLRRPAGQPFVIQSEMFLYNTSYRGHHAGPGLNGDEPSINANGSLIAEPVNR